MYQTPLHCEISEPEQAANACVIWLHGLGASGHDFVPVVPHLKIKNDAAIRFIFPHAPEIPVTCNGGYIDPELGKWGKTHDKVYSELTSDHPIDLTRYQVACAYMGKVGMINSGGASGSNDLAQAVRTAVINKRAGGMGLISGRKAFQKPLPVGIALLNAIQDVYLNDKITIA